MDGDLTEIIEKLKLAEQQELMSVNSVNNNPIIVLLCPKFGE